MARFVTTCMQYATIKYRYIYIHIPVTTRACGRANIHVITIWVNQMLRFLSELSLTFVSVGSLGSLISRLPSERRKSVCKKFSVKVTRLNVVLCSTPQHQLKRRDFAHEHKSISTPFRKSFSQFNCGTSTIICGHHKQCKHTRGRGATVKLAKTFTKFSSLS